MFIDDLSDEHRTSICTNTSRELKLLQRLYKYQSFEPNYEPLLLHSHNLTKSARLYVSLLKQSTISTPCSSGVEERKLWLHTSYQLHSIAARQSLYHSPQGMTLHPSSPEIIKQTHLLYLSASYIQVRTYGSPIV